MPTRSTIRSTDGSASSSSTPEWASGTCGVVMRMGGPSMDRAYLVPLLVMAIAFSLLFVTLHLAAMRNEILRRRVRSLQMLQASRGA